MRKRAFSRVLHAFLCSILLRVLPVMVCVCNHTYEHRLQYGESTCEVSGLPCQYDSDCSSGLCSGLYMLREEDVFDRTYTPLEELDKARLSRRLYPYCNSTAWSLQQYKDAVNNGNDYNLVGENIGEGTEGTYIPSFIKPTTPTISQGRQGLVATNVGKLILWAGGISGPYPGDESDVVDICDTTTKFSPPQRYRRLEMVYLLPRLHTGCWHFCYCMFNKKSSFCWWILHSPQKSKSSIFRNFTKRRGPIFYKYSRRIRCGYQYLECHAYERKASLYCICNI